MELVMGIIAYMDSGNNRNCSFDYFRDFIKEEVMIDETHI